MKHLKKFNNINELNTYKNDDYVYYPNVLFCNENNINTLLYDKGFIDYEYLDFYEVNGYCSGIKIPISDFKSKLKINENYKIDIHVKNCKYWILNIFHRLQLAQYACYNDDVFTQSNYLEIINHSEGWNNTLKERFGYLEFIVNDNNITETNCGLYINTDYSSDVCAQIFYIKLTNISTNKIIFDLHPRYNKKTRSYGLIDIMSNKFYESYNARLT